MAGADPGEKPPPPPAAAPGGGDSSLLGAGGRSGSETGVRGLVVGADPPPQAQLRPTGRRAPHDRVTGEQEESRRPTPTASVTGQRVGDDAIPSTAALHAVTARFLANLPVVDQASSSAPVPARQPSTEAMPTASELLDVPKSKECLLDTRPGSEDALVYNSLLGDGSATSALAQVCRRASVSVPGMSESETGVRGLAAAPTPARLLPFQFLQARGFRYEWEEPVPGSSADPPFTQVRPRGDVGVIGDRRPRRGAADVLGLDSAATTTMVSRALGAQLERALQPHGAVVGRKGFVQPDRDRRLALASHGCHSRAPSPANNFVMISRADVDRGWAALQQAIIERDMLIRQNHDLATALQEAAGRTQGLQQECLLLRQELQRHQTQRGGVAGQHECWDCFSRPAAVVAVPCLHKCLCHRCYVKRHSCPFCGLCWLNS
ncbi:hypothetical protein VPH35_008277 [Triticum aestivum]|uniref:uncharacterized protein n=1 Tax=Triticum aestivum TaxID=4565 RepID=UPI001D0103F6|nr:uncharacterized protein LOC123091141 [Triticum aestivum]